MVDDLREPCRRFLQIFDERFAYVLKKDDNHFDSIYSMAFLLDQRFARLWSDSESEFTLRGLKDVALRTLKR